jgi:hypothetical protein
MEKSSVREKFWRQKKNISFIFAERVKNEQWRVKYLTPILRKMSNWTIENCSVSSLIIDTFKRREKKFLI